MLIIFSASSDSGSSGHTSRIIGPLLRWLKPDISETAVRRIVYAVRKTAHVTEYAILALLVWRAWRNRARTSSIPPNPWRWSDAFVAVAFAALYAGSDEIHQLFVPSRDASFGDVMLDTTGAALGLLALWGLGRWRHRW